MLAQTKLLEQRKKENEEFAKQREVAAAEIVDL